MTEYDSPTYDRLSNFDLIDGEFVCPFDGQVMVADQGVFAAPGSYKANLITGLTCKCGHCLDYRVPYELLAITPVDDPMYMNRYWAATAINTMVWKIEHYAEVREQWEAEYADELTRDLAAAGAREGRKLARRLARQDRKARAARKAATRSFWGKVFAPVTVISLLALAGFVAMVWGL